MSEDEEKRRYEEQLWEFNQHLNQRAEDLSNKEVELEHKDLGLTRRELDQERERFREEEEIERRIPTYLRNRVISSQARITAYLLSVFSFLLTFADASFDMLPYAEPQLFVTVTLASLALAIGTNKEVHQRTVSKENEHNRPHHEEFRLRYEEF